jgi:hypothetical protein
MLFVMQSGKDIDRDGRDSALDDVDNLLHAPAVPSREACNGVLICTTHINHPTTVHIIYTTINNE